jgi:steroid 5-alpha reductase family enzyme
VLLFIITAPTYILLLCSIITGDGLSSYDHFFSKSIFLLVLVEFFADQQQWEFHGAKEQYRRTAKVPKDHKYTREQLDRGFNTNGLWAWSRHPNFAAEQAVWMCLYQWCCCESGTFMNWCFVGALSYLFLFQASTWLTELLSAGKYAEYKVYQQRVGKFLPKRVTRSMDATKISMDTKGDEQIKDSRAHPTAGKTKKR